MYRLLLPVVLASLLAFNLTACAVHLSTNWVDTHQESSEQVKAPFYCHLFTCQEAKGS